MIIAFGVFKYCLIVQVSLVLFVIPSIAACESVKILIFPYTDGMARTAVQMAINSALVDDGHDVVAQPY